MSVNEVINVRRKLGMSQEDLSDSLGILGATTVSRWETGLRKPSETIRRLFCWLNDLPKKQAEEIVKTLGQYKKKR